MLSENFILICAILFELACTQTDKPVQKHNLLGEVILYLYGTHTSTHNQGICAHKHVWGTYGARWGQTLSLNHCMRKQKLTSLALNYSLHTVFRKETQAKQSNGVPLPHPANIQCLHVHPSRATLRESLE